MALLEKGQRLEAVIEEVIRGSRHTGGDRYVVRLVESGRLITANEVTGLSKKAQRGLNIGQRVIIEVKIPTGTEPTCRIVRRGGRIERRSAGTKTQNR